MGLHFSKISAIVLSFEFFDFFRKKELLFLSTVLKIDYSSIFFLFNNVTTAPANNIIAVI